MRFVPALTIIVNIAKYYCQIVLSNIGSGEGENFFVAMLTIHVLVLIKLADADAD